MMNFLDLSAASEEERRVIKEILADTSVVNFVEPLGQQFNSLQHQQHQQDQHHNQNHHQQQHRNQPTNKQLQLQPQAIKAKLQLNQNQNKTIPLSVNNLHSNHVHNHETLVEQENQQQQKYRHHPVPPSHVLATANLADNNVTPQNLTTSQTTLPINNTAAYTYNINSGATHNSYENTTIYSNSNNSNINSNVRKSYHTNNVNSIDHTKSQAAYSTTNSQENSPTPLQTTITDVVAKNTPTTIQTSSNNETFTTSNSTQSSSTVPPQTVANQLPPQMAGDMNSVIGIDMSPSQPQGYAIPAPPPTHVTAFGPGAPPPPHHVYGGPPIFQPTYTHYIFPYNLPYPMSYVLPPTSSVVPTRQQVASQSNQPPNSTLTNSPHSRSHSHHPRPNRPKDMQKQQQQQQQHHHQHQQQQHLHQNHHQQLQHQHQHPHQHQYQHQHQQQHQSGYRPNVNVDSSMSKVNDISGQHGDPYLNYGEKSYQQHETPRPKDVIESTRPEEGSRQDEPQQNSQPEVVEDSRKVTNEEETIKVSSDEGFDTQSSLDVSKQSHESSSAFVSDRQSKSPREDCNNSEKDRATVESLKSDHEEKSQQVQEPKASGAWKSASSKSWASLFKADGTPCNRSSIKGNTEHNNINSDPENSEDDTNENLKVPTNPEDDIRVTNSVVSTKEQRSQDAARRALDKLAPRVAQKINSISLKHSLPLLRPRGFINKGNGCYINSTLQALIACPPFYNLMKEIGDLRGLQRENSSTPILDNFVELFQHFPPLDANKKNKQSAPSDQKLQMNYLQADAIEPKCIYNVLGDIKSECLRGAQEDAEEFLSSVLNGLHEEMIGLSEALQSAQNNTNNLNGHLSDTEDINGDLNNDENLWREVGPKNRSLPIRSATVINTPIQEIFGGSLFSIRTAGRDRCGHRSPFFDLQLDISGDHVKSLQDAIKSFTATEIIQDFYCSKTKQKLDAQRRTSLDQLPPILILHLKQFIYTQDHGLKKLMKRIEYPIDFELPEGCLHDKNSDKSLKNSRSYKLLAVVYHDGKEAVKGHYLTDVYHIGSSQWIRCDDSNLKVVPAPRIENPESSRTPYLLFYRRLNTLGPRQSNSHDNKKKS